MRVFVCSCMCVATQKNNCNPPPPPPKSAEFGRLRRFFLLICWISGFRAFVLLIRGVSVNSPIRFAVLPFLSILVVQIGTMKCFYCPQNDASVVHWDSLSRDDQISLQDEYPDAGQGAAFDLCVHSARPSVFSSRRSSGTSSSAPQSADSELQVPSGPLVMSGAATSLATESVESGVVEPSASVAESNTPCVRPEHGHTRPARLELDRLSTQRVQKRIPAPHLLTPVPALPPKVLTPPPPYPGWTKQRPHTAAHRNPI